MSYSVAIFDQTGSQTSSVDLDDSIFNIENKNPDLLQEYLVMHLANQRVAIAHTKTRAEVAGSGKKLYKQKGTGHARVGDAGSPIRRGGGVVFGPRNNRNFSKDMNKKMKQGALLSAFIVQLEQNVVLGLTDFGLTSISTKFAVSVLHKLPSSTTKTLVVLDSENDIIKKSIKNIPHIIFTHVDRLNSYDILNAKHVIFTGTSLDIIVKKLSS